MESDTLATPGVSSHRLLDEVDTFQRVRLPLNAIEDEHRVTLCCRYYQALGYMFYSADACRGFEIHSRKYISHTYVYRVNMHFKIWQYFFYDLSRSFLAGEA